MGPGLFLAAETPGTTASSMIAHESGDGLGLEEDAAWRPE